MTFQIQYLLWNPLDKHLISWPPYASFPKKRNDHILRCLSLFYLLLITPRKGEEPAKETQAIPGKLRRWE